MFGFLSRAKGTTPEEVMESWRRMEKWIEVQSEKGHRRITNLLLQDIPILVAKTVCPDYLNSYSHHLSLPLIGYLHSKYYAFIKFCWMLEIKIVNNIPLCKFGRSFK